MKGQRDETTRTKNIYTRVLEVMDKEQPYLDPALTLNKLARIVGTNRSTLSMVLNSQTKQHFCKWLATYRVNHAIRLMELHPDKILTELYTLSGFSSRTSFFRQYREMTGKSPREHETDTRSAYEK